MAITRKENEFNTTFLLTANTEETNKALAALEKLVGEPGAILTDKGILRFVFMSELAAYKFAFYVSNTPNVEVTYVNNETVERWEVSFDGIA